MVSTRVIPNRSVNFAQEFHHFDGQGGGDKKMHTW